MTVNVRIIAATNRDLEQAVREGKFRRPVPPVERLSDPRSSVAHALDDIPLLAWAFVETIGRRMGKTIKNISRRTMEQLQRYPWPGNVRELSNVIERAMILTTGDDLQLDLPFVAEVAPAPPRTLKESERGRSCGRWTRLAGEFEVPAAPPRSSGSSQRRWRRGWQSSVSNASSDAPTFRRRSPSFWRFRRASPPPSACRLLRKSCVANGLTR